MTVLETDLASSRWNAAVAADLFAKLHVLSEEIDRRVEEDRRLAEICGCGAGTPEEFEYAGLTETLAVFGFGAAKGADATVSGDAILPSLDEILVVSLLEREANRRALVVARKEHEDLVAARGTASDTVEHHRQLVTRWTEALSECDPGLGATLSRLESEEGSLLRGMIRLEAAQVAAREAERALDCLRVIFQDAVDWERVDHVADESHRSSLRIDGLSSADTWICEAQVLLARTHRTLRGTEYLDAGAFQVDLLFRFAGMCIANLGRDIAARDGTGRASRSVSWTLTTVRSLGGYLARSLIEMNHSLEALRLGRTRLLSRT